MINAKDYFEVGLEFHGHKCPAMPLGLRAGAAAMNALNVERSQDKELYCISETGKGHAAGCFLDGIMTITSCTYGKSNIEKKYYNKMAFTLIDMVAGKSVRVSLKPDFFEKTLQGPFVQERKKGILPQDISADVADPLIENVLKMPEENFLDIGEVMDYEVVKGKGEFNAERCSVCGELTFVNKLVDGVCIPCREK